MAPKGVSPLDLLEQALTSRAGDTITLEELRVALGERSFGFVLILACIPSLIPVPGVGSVAGFLPMILGAMLVAGYQQPWLPSFVLNRPIPQRYLFGFLEKAKPLWAQVEKLIHPRWEWVFSPIGERVMGIIVIIHCIFILFPGPLTNLLPAAALVVLGLAMVTKDGILALLAYALGFVFMTFLVLVYGGLMYAGYLGLQRVFGG